MKAYLSRYSFNADKRYSGLYLQQGRMITDDDQNTLNQIHKTRVNDLGGKTIKNGVPDTDGMLKLTSQDASQRLPAFQNGDVFIDGIRGRFISNDLATVQRPLSPLSGQVDLPASPAITGPNLLYVDMWERSVFPLEDPELVDIGWHGADTSYRSRTMVQVKAAPIGTTFNRGAYPAHGSALLDATLQVAATSKDPCDPCSVTLGLNIRTGNHLFRLEVINVTGPADRPERISLAWSVDNGAALYPADMDLPSDFKRFAVFEYTSEITEAHKGAFMDPATRRESQLVAGPLGDTPNRTDGKPGKWPNIRGWNGAAILELTYTDNSVTGITLASPIDGAPQQIDLNTPIEINTDTLKLSLDVLDGPKARAFLNGDYWLVTVREHAEKEADKVKVMSAEPKGITHHYLPLFEIIDDHNPAELDDASTRRLSFPALSNITADHVGFENLCPKLYDDAKNVQEALDNLCSIEAADIKFTPDGPCREFYDNAENVEDALEALCSLDLDVHKHTHFMHDWGVTCGLRVECFASERNLLRIHPGTFVTFGGEMISLSKVRDIKFNDLITPLHDNPVCLAIEHIKAENKIEFRLVTDKEVRTLRGPSYEERKKECDRIADILITTTKLFTNSEKILLRTALVHAEKDSTLKKTVPANRAEYDTLKNFFNNVKEGLDISTSCNEVAKLGNFPNIIQAFSGVTLKRLQAKVRNAYRRMINTVRQAEADCRCRLLIPDCPENVEARWVPLAQIIFDNIGNEFAVFGVDHHQCRKVAMTWRNMDYWYRELYQGRMRKLYDLNCNYSNLPPLGQPPGDIHIFPVDPPFITDPPFFPGRPVLPGLPDTIFLGLKKEDGIRELERIGIKVSKTIELSELDSVIDKVLLSGNVTVVDNLRYGDKLGQGDEVAILLEKGRIHSTILVNRADPVLGPQAIPNLNNVSVIAPGEIKVIDEKLTALKAERTALDEKLFEIREQRDKAEAAVIALKETELTVKSLKEESQTFGARVKALRAEAKTLDDFSEEIKRSAEVEVGKATVSLDIIKGTRTELLDDISSLRKDITDLNAARDGAIRGAEKARTTLAKDLAEGEDSLRAIKRKQPVSFAVEDPAHALRISVAGVKSIGDLADLSGAKFKEVRISTGLTDAVLRKIVRNAKLINS